MVQRLLTLVRQAGDARSDADLLALVPEDRAAFAELVARHGSMVWSVCRHMLRETDAEDAFQATFVALFRSSIRDRAALASWLYGVVVRISLNIRREAARRRVRERAAAASEMMPPQEPDDWADTMAVVHKEVAALPEAERSAFVLCVLEGLTQAEASARLGRTPGAVAGQVSRAKKRLMARLTERGITPGLAALGTASVADAVPLRLMNCLLNPQEAGVPLAVLRLAKGATGMTRMSKKLILAAVGALCVVFAAVGLHLNAAVPPGEKPIPKDDKPGEVLVAKEADAGRTWKGKVSEKGTGKAIVGAEVVVTITADENKAKKQDKILRKVMLKSGADGTYEFPITAEEAARGSLYIELTITSPDHTEYFGGYGYSLILKNETLGTRPFFENIMLWPGKPIEGIVKTPEGKPAAGVKVLAYTVPLSPTGGRYGNASRFPETKTDAMGRFRLTVYAESKSVFWILPQDFAPEVHGIAKDQRGDLGAFTLAKGERLAGKLLDSEGKPVAGVYVEAGVVRTKEDKQEVVPNNVVNQIHRATLTAADGSFEFRPLPVGTYRITPTEKGWDPSTQARNQEPAIRPLTAVFLPRQATLKMGEALAPVVIHAVPHVVLDAQWLNSKGAKRGGNDIHIFGSLGKRVWNATCSPSADGACHLLVPKGLDDAQLSVIYDPDSALQFRMQKGEPLQYTREFRLGKLDEDLKGMEIIHYAAPTIIIGATGKDGKAIPNLMPSVTYTDPNFMGGSRLLYKGKTPTDVPFEELKDSKIRTIQLVPDREVTVTVTAEGFQPASRKLTLSEGKTEEIKFVLEPK